MKNNKKIKPKQFRRNNARTGHPAYIVQVNKGKVEFIGITSASKTQDVKNIKLEKNPNPNSSEDSYIRPKTDNVVLTNKTFGKELKGWKFSANDKKKVKRVIKKSARR